MSAPGTPERGDLKDPAQQLRPAAAGFRERGRHELSLHGLGLLVGTSPAPNAAGPVGVPAVVALEHLALVGNVARHARQEFQDVQCLAARGGTRRLVRVVGDSGVV